MSYVIIILAIPVGGRETKRRRDTERGNLTTKETLSKEPATVSSFPLQFLASEGKPWVMA
jgi:hypothetical protein